MTTHGAPRIVVLSSLFPSAGQPRAGLFVRERMFRVGQHLPLCVVSPVPRFPFQGLVRLWRPGFRPATGRQERQGDFDVWYPRFLSMPGVLKRLDGLFMALGAWPRLRQLKRAGRLDIIDAHFGYPDGYAATLLGKWLGVPVTITLRGTEARQVHDHRLAGSLRRALRRANRVFSVSQSLRQVAADLGISPDHVRVVGNGVDLDKFAPVSRAEARKALRLPAEAPVLITVGGLVERKGFHRVIECLPSLLREHPGLTYLVVGGPGPEGDMSEKLQQQAQALGVAAAVRFLGPMPAEELRVPLSAADLFVLATRNEGWANVLLEAMACGLPVVATDVGGNSEVVCDPGLGTIVPFGDSERLQQAIAAGLRTRWDVDAIRRYAASNTWDRRVTALVSEFRALHRATINLQRNEEDLDRA
jgi:teichuronic acid biosynthesis glycosyltransferase TuaC